MKNRTEEPCMFCVGQHQLGCAKIVLSGSHAYHTDQGKGGNDDQGTTHRINHGQGCTTMKASKTREDDINRIKEVKSIIITFPFC